MSDIVKILPHLVDLDDTIKKTELHTIFVMGDSLAHRFEITIRSGGRDVDLSGCTVMANFTNFREKTTIEMTGEVKDGKAVVTLTRPCYTLRGQFVLSVQIKAGETDATVFVGEGHMRTSRAEKIVYDDYVVYDVETLLSQIGTMITVTSEATTAAGNAADAAAEATAAAGRAENAAAGASGWNNAEMGVQMLPSGYTPEADIETAGDGHKIITLRIPKGDTGATPQITFEVSTGEPGTDVELVQIGTPENPVIQLKIPRGDTGAVDGIDYYAGAPKAPGVASPGTANGVARGDHVHPTPSASDVGALPKDATAEDSKKLGGVEANQYALKTDIPEDDGDADTLGGNPPEYYMADYGRCDVLWEGSWSGGTITVPNTNKYTAYKIDMASQGSSIFAFRHNTHIRGVGGFYYLSGSCATSYQFTATFSGDEWSFVACNSLVHNPNGNHGKLDDRTVSAIIGLF